MKQQISEVIRSEPEVTIDDAQAFYDTAKEFIEKPWPANNVCNHSMLNFIYTAKISRRPNTKSWQGVSGTREEIHSIMNRNQGLKVNYRKVICMCSNCMHGTKGNCEYSDYANEWKGFDMAQFTSVPADLTYWGQVKVRKVGGSSLEFSWSQKLTKLASFTSYSDLQEHILHNPIPMFVGRVSAIFMPEDNELVDAASLHYRPIDCPSNYTPCSIIGDGNCFPRTLSFLAFHTQECHIEMRVHLVYEAVLNASLYLSNHHLGRGATVVYNHGVLGTMAIYSPGYTANSDIHDCYKKEVMLIAHEGSYCGLWQLAQAANVLHHPIVSVFPEINGRYVKHDDFNRKFACANNAYNQRGYLYIMWTSMQVSENNIPNHFVPLLLTVSCLRSS